MLAQSSPFGPLPQAAPTPTPTPDDNTASVLGQDVGRSTLYLIGGGFLIFFIASAGSSRATRAARCPRTGSDEAVRRRPDPAERRKREREKERARQKTRAQKAARKAHRKR